VPDNDYQAKRPFEPEGGEWGRVGEFAAAGHLLVKAEKLKS
jgi:hypothetical protein